MSVYPYELNLLDHPEYRAHRGLLLYILPLLLVIGTVGNVLSLSVLTRRSMIKTSTYIYLIALAVMDLLSLYNGLLRLWISEMTGWDIIDEANWSCKTITMVGYITTVCSSWLLIAVTVERYIVTVHSLHAATMCTRSRAIKVILGMFAAILCTNLHFLWSTELEYDYYKNTTFCSSTGSEASIYLMRIWSWVDGFLYSMAPSVIICVLNGLIISKIKSIRQRRIVQPASSTTSSSEGSSTHHSPGESSVRVTVMLLAVSFSFLLCTFPIIALMLYGATALPHNMTSKDIARMKLATTIGTVFMYTNHSINFYLYVLTGRKFRQELKEMLCCFRQQRHHHGSDINSHGDQTLAYELADVDATSNKQ